jgi:hypothetical protein
MAQALNNSFILRPEDGHDEAIDGIRTVPNWCNNGWTHDGLHLGLLRVKIVNTDIDDGK